MKFSYNWLKELSETNKTPKEVKNDLTTHSFEVESIEELGKNLEKVVIGEVLNVEKHPDADKLNVAKVNVGDNELQIVCGAPNLKVGQKVPVALVGAILPGDFEIKEAEIRGIKSSGMICAEDELGLGTEHAGIMVLAEVAPVGEKFINFLGLDDSVLEIDILPNRAHDALSYEGMAREIALLERRVILNKKENLKERFLAKDDLKIVIETERCPRYIGAKIKNIKIGESPIWIKSRLKASGLNPINNIVDITNYVMLQTGQPLHAFDAKQVYKIGVRLAKQGEELIILSGEGVKLRTQDIVITDGEKPIALAGVMGGLESGINDDTQEIILESANFDAVTIRKTKSLHRIDSDAAYRYERDIDVNLTEHAIIKAIELIVTVVGGEVEFITDNYPEVVSSWEVDLEIEKVNNLLGVKIPQADIIDILEKLDIVVLEKNTILNCKIPTRRIDLKNQEDLIEEIGRIFGYTKILTKPLKEKVQVPKKNKERELERVLKDIMVHSGFDEVRGYSFYSKEDARALGLDDENHVSLMNPMNSDQELIRRTLISGLLKAGKKSLSYFEGVNIFDVGKIYAPNSEGLPKEDLMIVGAIIEKGEKGEQFFALKGALENLFYKIGIKKIKFVNDFKEDAMDVVSLHSSRKALIKADNGEVLGLIGEITKSAHKHFGIKKVRGCVFELNIKALLGEINYEKKYKQLAKFPSVNRDISMVVSERTLAEEVKNEIAKSGGELLNKIELFDVFVNPQTAERSMAFHLTFAHQDKTLTAVEVDEIIKKIIKNCEDNLEASVKRN
jgi:phenylalanyl-tRNA synthetase beta chain